MFTLIPPREAGRVSASSSLPVVINEVMPNPLAASDRSEWLELYNYGDAAINLQDWEIDGHVITDQQLLLLPKSYLIITKQLVDFESEFGEVTNVRELNISLANTSDSIELKYLDQIVDTFIYSSSTSAFSWERLGPLCTEIVKHPSSHSLDQLNVAIDESCYPAIPGLSNPIQRIELSLNGTDWSESLTARGPVNLQARYSLNYPVTPVQASWKLAGAGAVSFPLSVNNFTDRSIVLTLTTAEGEFTKTSNALTIFPQLYLNEFMPNPDGQDTGSEWVEIYNPDSFEVSLKDVSIHDASGEIHAFHSSDYLKAGEYLVVTFPRSVLLNCTQSTACSDSLTLLRGELVVDTVSYSNSLSGQSWSRENNGHWSMDYEVTKGMANASVTTQVPGINKGISSDQDEELIGEEEKTEIPKEVVDTELPLNAPAYGLPDFRIKSIGGVLAPELIDVRPYLLIFSITLAISLITLAHANGYLEKLWEWWAAG